MNSKNLAEIAVDALGDLKGQAISCIEVSSLTSITDYMVIVTGRSNTHIKALSDSVVKKIKEAKQEIIGVEGRMQSEWVLVDCGDVFIHIMLAPALALYNLEELWSFDAPKKNQQEQHLY